ncbi:MAG: DUF1732 domain-containing protein [Deltaproteobacteria bacterium]|nr:MAG: DUF1732 domain-containing protein [Deltaproteobacteria bacterium]
MRSMTGFGQGVTAVDHAEVRVTVRTLNGRALEVRSALAPALMNLEPSVLEIVRPRIHRGRVDVRADLEITATMDDDGSEHLRGVDRLAETLDKLRFRYGVQAPLSLDHLLHAGAMMQVEAAMTPPVVRLKGALESALEDALHEVEVFRDREGTILRRFFEDACSRLEQLVGAIADAAKGAGCEMRQKLEDRVGRLLTEAEFAGATEERVASEIALLAQRADIEEEIQRAGMHIARLRELVGPAQGPGPVGKRVDFMLQELLREANTMAAKSSRAELTHRVVDAKAIIEQLREQAHNIE